MSTYRVHYWIHCDIDGKGKRWRLAVDRGGEVYFPVEDFGEEMSLDEYRKEFPGNAIDRCRPPKRDPRIDQVIGPVPARVSQPWKLVATCSACFAEGIAWSEPENQDAGWATLRQALRAAGWIVLDGDERPAASRPRHAKSTRQFCPSCVAELLAVQARVENVT